MRYIIVLISLLVFVGCGGGNGGGTEDVKTSPASPKAKDVKNIPPSVPNI